MGLFFLKKLFIFFATQYQCSLPPIPPSPSLLKPDKAVHLGAWDPQAGNRCRDKSCSSCQGPHEDQAAYLLHMQGAQVQGLFLGSSFLGNLQVSKLWCGRATSPPGDKILQHASSSQPSIAVPFVQGAQQSHNLSTPANCGCRLSPVLTEGKFF